MVSNVLSWVPPLAELGNKNGEQCSLLGATPGWIGKQKWWAMFSPGYHPWLNWETKMVSNVLSWVPPLAGVWTMFSPGYHPLLKWEIKMVKKVLFWVPPMTEGASKNDETMFSPGYHPWLKWETKMVNKNRIYPVYSPYQTINLVENARIIKIKYLADFFLTNFILNVLYMY